MGDVASHPVAAIAEDANNAVAESAYSRLRGVHDVFTGDGGPIPSGASRTYTVETEGSFNRLSIVTMLVNTNDAFTGLDSLHPRAGGAVLHRMAYDAGSERNNERSAFIPGPCCGNPFVRDPEGELIRMHPALRASATSTRLCGAGLARPPRFRSSGSARDGENPGRAHRSARISAFRKRVSGTLFP